MGPMFLESSLKPDQAHSPVTKPVVIMVHDAPITGMSSPQQSPSHKKSSDAGDTEVDGYAKGLNGTDTSTDPNSPPDFDPYADADLDVPEWAKNLKPASPAKKKKVSNRHRADNAAFDIWIEQNQHALTRSERRPVSDNDKSFQALVKGLGHQEIITSPRDYQLELFERAKEQNTIAVLDTGSGKTLIAALLLRWTLQNELENRAKGMSRRVAFFLVDKVALVLQQHAVLACNLDYPIDKFCGEMIEDVEEDKSFWDKTFAENMAIVCTADILYKCLAHSYIRMDEINLLVFDEAHHAKKNHTYARIIKDFYVDVEEDKRPRILGMTASPVDAQVDPKVAAAELEGLLHAQIATAADPAALQYTLTRLKAEEIVEFDRRPDNWETPLNQRLKMLVGQYEVFHKPFAFTETACAELGPWCADRYWQLFFREEDLARLEARCEMEILGVSAYRQDTREQVSRVRQAYDLVKNHEFGRPKLSTDSLSSKVIELVKVLRKQFEDPDQDPRCIVFVKQRNTASLLVDLLQQPEMHIEGLKSGMLVGSGRADAHWDNTKVSFRNQVRTIIKFRKGVLNCIFATSVAEEGLDIPDCNVIIRYDLNETLIQYIQSRGRARRHGSIYIHMVERGNPRHRRRLHENKANEDALRRFCEALPEDRKLTGNNFNMDYFLRKEMGQQQYIVPGTGAKLNYKQALVILANFVSSLPHPPETVLAPEYVICAVPGGFQCEVMLPPQSPVRSATGKVHPRKAMAKCSAAFELCLKLIKGKYLDAHLRPVFTKQLPAMRNARLAVSAKKKAEYQMRIKPEMWARRGEPKELYVTVLALENPGAVGRETMPLLLLTREPLPKLAKFTLFYGQGPDRTSQVRCVPVPGRIVLDEEGREAKALAGFTLRVFHDVFSKDFEARVGDLPYFIAPATKGHGEGFEIEEDVRGLVDWEVVFRVQEGDRIPYDVDAAGEYADEFFKGHFVVDPYDGSRKYFLRGRRHDMKATDTVPEGIVPPGHAWRGVSTRDILNYSLTKWKRSREKTTLNPQQPVVEAELMPLRRNLLDDNIGEDDLEPKQCFLVLEPLRISPLPAKTAMMAYSFPAIIHRIESNLIALDACRLVGLDIRPDLALEALTKDSDNTGEHDAEQISFQPGMGNNYERLEFLGDCFLKMATTIAIFTLIPDKEEFEYHVERMLLICNRNLFNNALEFKLEEYIRSMAFNRHSWYPNNLTLKSGKTIQPRRTHLLADKSIADVCEALIGAALLTGQDRAGSTAPEQGAFDLAIRAVSTLVKSPRHSMSSYSEYYSLYTPPAWQTAPCSSAQVDMAARFACRLGYTFRHPRLLRSAFQHPTYPSVYEHLPSYQRLEFLGDALLDMAIVEWLFARFPGADPQWLTEHKMAMVSNQFLGCLGFMLGFHKNIACCSPQVGKDLARYVAEMEEALLAAKEDAVRAGKTEDDWARDFWLNCSRPPKCLPDVVEAYVGAVFVDSGYNFGEVRAFLERHIRPFFEDMRLYDTFANNHPVTMLVAVMQGQFRCQEWRVLARELPAGPVAVALDGEDTTSGGEFGEGETRVVCAVRCHGQTLAHAVAASGRYGKVAAAKKALEVLRKMEVEEYRQEFGCTCAGEEGGNEEELEAHASAV